MGGLIAVVAVVTAGQGLFPAETLEQVWGTGPPGDGGASRPSTACCRPALRLLHEAALCWGDPALWLQAGQAATVAAWHTTAYPGVASPVALVRVQAASAGGESLSTIAARISQSL